MTSLLADARDTHGQAAVEARAARSWEEDMVSRKDHSAQVEKTIEPASSPGASGNSEDAAQVGGLGGAAVGAVVVVPQRRAARSRDSPLVPLAWWPERSLV